MSLETTLSIAGFVLGALATILSGYWAIAKLVVAQFDKRLDERFKGQEQARAESRAVYDERLGKAEDALRTLERRFLEHLAELPRDYTRREDQIRFETVINAKLDALGSKQELLIRAFDHKE